MSNYGYPSQSFPPYYPAALNGNLFLGANQAVVTTALPAGLTATYTGGLTLYNPLTSPHSLSIVQASITQVVGQTNAAAISLGTGFSASVLPSGTLTVVASTNATLNGRVASGILYSSTSVTLPVAPTLAVPLFSLETGAITTSPSQAPMVYNTEGRILIPPGGYACFVSSAAGTASSLIFGLVWQEI